MDKERARRLFLTAFFLFALANGLSGSIISNYFKDVFQVDSVQRGLLEIPRELPGVVGVFVIAALPSLGNVSLSVLGFALYCVGLLVLGLFSPGYFIMQLFVFTYSLGDHMVMPIRDAIAMDLADEGKTGTFLGRYRGMMTLGSMLASALVFVGFRVGFFYFRTGVIPSFCAALVFLIVALALLCRLRKTLPALDVRKRSGERRRLPIRRRYLPYYIVTAVYGFQKRMRLVFAPWVIIELLSMGADTVYGVQKGLVLESAGVAGVFLFAAWAASGIVNGSLRGWGGMAAAFASYILIFLTDHFNSVHVMLMRELSESPADVMENLSFGLSVDHVLAVTVSGLLGAVWKYVGPQYVFLLGAAVCTVHLGVALWLKRQRRAAV